MDNANTLIGRSIQAILEGRKSSTATAFTLGHPENLGSRWPGYTPASIWDLQALRDLSDEPGVTQGALFHCAFGANYAGPTRFMTSLPYKAELKLKLGPTQLDIDANYVGPLAAWCGHRHSSLYGKDIQRKFLTKHKAAYSTKLCEAITMLQAKAAGPRWGRVFWSRYLGRAYQIDIGRRLRNRHRWSIRLLRGRVCSKRLDWELGSWLPSFRALGRKISALC